MSCPLQQVPRYQKSDNVVNHKITEDWKSIYKILELIPRAPLLDIAAAEGFVVWMAGQRGYPKAHGIEIDEGRVLRGRKHLGVSLEANSVFDRLSILKDYRIFVVSRFFHNVGEEQSKILMDAIDQKDEYILIVKHKKGPRKENGKKREPLATRKGVNAFLDNYPVTKKSFPGDVIVAAKGGFDYIPGHLRKHLPEP